MNNNLSTTQMKTRAKKRGYSIERNNDTKFWKLRDITHDQDDVFIEFKTIREAYEFLSEIQTRG